MYDVGGEPPFSTALEFTGQKDNFKAIIFVVAADQDISKAADKLKDVLAQDELKGLPILFYVSKQDLPDVMTPEDAAKKLDLENLMAGRKWHIMGTICATKKVLQAGWKWLGDTLIEIHKGGGAASKQ